MSVQCVSVDKWYLWADDFLVNFTTITTIDNEKYYPQIPKKFSLHQNYPNPFNPTTTIIYDIPKMSDISINVYDIRGRLVETLVNEKQQLGYYSVQWDASQFSSGVYFYQIKADAFQQVKKCLLIK